jgi:hypothetical protein
MTGTQTYTRGSLRPRIGGRDQLPADTERTQFGQGLQRARRRRKQRSALQYLLAFGAFPLLRLLVLQRLIAARTHTRAVSPARPCARRAAHRSCGRMPLESGSGVAPARGTQMEWSKCDQRRLNATSATSCAHAAAVVREGNAEAAPRADIRCWRRARASCGSARDWGWWRRGPRRGT